MREDALNFWGNIHGGMELIDGEWYIFYHRHTNRTQFSRQACAEKIEILTDGSIRQAEMTSCGLNGGPLEGKGTYEARIACNLMGKTGTTMSRPENQTSEYPFFTQQGADCSPDKGEPYPVPYIANMSDGSVAGFKYFDFQNVKEIRVKLRAREEHGAKGRMVVSDVLRGKSCGFIPITAGVCAGIGEWKEFSGNVEIANGVKALYFEYQGEGTVDFFSFELI